MGHFIERSSNFIPSAKGYLIVLTSIPFWGLNIQKGKRLDNSRGIYLIPLRSYYGY